MSVEAINALIDEWLRHNLEEDAQAREGLSRRPFRYAIVRGSPLEREFVRGLEAHEIPDPKDYPGGLVPLPNVALAADEAFVHNVSRSYPHDQRQWMRLLGADEALRRRDIGLVEADVSALLKSKGIQLDPESDEFFDACMSMLRARAELAREVRERAETNWRPVQRDADPSPRAYAGAVHAGRKIGVSLTEGARSFIPQAARTEGISAKRKRDYEIAVRSFVEWVGEDLDLADVSSKQAGSFMNALGLYPVNGVKKARYRELDFRGRVELSKELEDEDVLNPTTINGKYLTPLRKMFEWYRRSGFTEVLPVNPFDGVAASKPRHRSRKDARRPFTDQEVRGWLSQPLFIGSRSPSQAGLYLSGDVRVSDWRYWLPLISLFSGMRHGEVLGLALADFKTADGVHYFSLREGTEEQSLKTDSSWRKVPIHEELIRLGLLEYVQSRQRRSETMLFDLPEGGVPSLSDRASKFFVRMVQKIADPNADAPGQLVPYSTRHTVISKLRNASVRQDVSKTLVGHEDGDVHAGYGDHSLASLQEAINRISYRDLDLTKVRLPSEVLEGKRPY
ncbi:site-specific integrase [uncultured Brevundimonas sp.]|uniref:site-specific integrase n=1 Tax=uncultured Brevundimonas sp. TaxID=213418 RepID=UPI0025F547D7|nr:site-specific integrase [uncultured Brevundimonas sp.]